MFSLVPVTDAFKRGAQHEAGPGKSNVTLQVEATKSRDTVFPYADSIWNLCVRHYKASAADSLPLHFTAHKTKVSYLFDSLHALYVHFCMHLSKPHPRGKDQAARCLLCNGKLICDIF